MQCEPHDASVSPTMNLLRFGATIIIGGLTSCQLVFREGGQDAANDATEPTVHNVIFLTEQVYDGNLGGRAGADAKCRAAAIAANLVGNFVAVLGESGGGTDALATSRISMARGWVRPDGKPVMTNAADLTSGNQWYPINQDQYGNDLSSSAEYWSGSEAAGSVGLDCNKWSGGAMANSGAFGHGQIAAGLGVSRQPCNKTVHLLCAAIDLQAPLTPPQGTGKRIFVSTVPFGPNPTGRKFADDVCATEATMAQLGGTFLAFLGTKTSSPISRFNGLDTYQRIDGQPLGLLGAPPLSFINRSAGNTIVNSQVWAEAPGAIPSANCQDWTLTASVFGYLGRSNSAGSGAYSDYFMPNSNCLTSFRVYCVEQ